MLSLDSRGRRIAHRVLGLTALSAFAGLALAEVMFVVFPRLDAAPHRVEAVVQLGGGPAVSYEESRNAAVQGGAGYLFVSSPEAGAPDASAVACSPLKGVKVVCFVPEPYTTQGESRAIARLADEFNIDSILVFASSSQHVARARTIIGRCFDGNLAVRAHPVDLSFRQLVDQWAYQSGAWVKALTVVRSC